MTSPAGSTPPALPRDLMAGAVVFLLALPLCLGVALASNAPLFAGLLAGIVGGIVVGLLSGSHTSVSGPAAGLTAIVVSQISSLGSFQAFLFAVTAAGLIQIVLGLARVGFLAAFFPTSVIKGLLAAIGVILILKQIPHLVGYHADPFGDLAFRQPDNQNTFSELAELTDGVHRGAAAVGLLSLAVLVLWDRWKQLKRSPVPAPLVVVLLGVCLGGLFRCLGGAWELSPTYLVRVPVADGLSGFAALLQSPDFSQWSNPAVYVAAATIAAVASLETLLNLEAVDKLDPQQRASPPNRELWAQGVGNVVSGLVGGLPVTSVVVRGSANIYAGARTRRATVFHGVLLLVSVALLPTWLNAIPLSCLAAILLATGIKLLSPALVQRMWGAGRTQFVPFALTVAAIVLTDLLTGVLMGLTAAVGFILWSSVRRPLQRIVEQHLAGSVVHIELADQVSFLNRAALVRALDSVPPDGHVLLDARRTDYIDPDVLGLIRDFKDLTAPARGVEVSLLGFQCKYRLGDRTRYVVHSTRDLQARLSPEQVLQILKDGHTRFRSGRRLTRDLGRQVTDTSDGQHPLAVVLSCIDSRTPAELVFDLGVGDVMSVRIAGNVTSREVLGSVEYGCAVAGAKLVLVMGHTRCGAVGAAVDLVYSGKTAAEATGCLHLDHIFEAIRSSIDLQADRAFSCQSGIGRASLVDVVVRRNVLNSVQALLQQSDTLGDLERRGQVRIVGAVYDIVTGDIEFLTGTGVIPNSNSDGRAPDVAISPTQAPRGHIRSS